MAIVEDYSQQPANSERVTNPRSEQAASLIAQLQLSVTTIQQAGKELCAFTPPEVEVPVAGKPHPVTLIKLPRGDFETGYGQFLDVIGPAFLTDEEQPLPPIGAGDGINGVLVNGELLESAPQPPSLLDTLRKLGKQCPELLDWLIEKGTTGISKAQTATLDWDAWLLLAAGVITVNFVNNAAVRCFFAAAPSANLSAIAEQAAAASSAPTSAGGA